MDLSFVSTQTSISYVIETTDSDNILEITKVAIYLDDDLVAQTEDLDESIFNDLSNRLAKSVASPHKRLYV